MTQHFGINHFLTQADAVAWVLLTTLLLMSVCTWTLIVQRISQVRRENSQHTAWIKAGFKAFEMMQPHAKNSLLAWIYAATRSPKQTLTEDALLDHCACQLDSGQTLLASIAATAPFLGLLGTVWGIYHALTAIAVAGEASIDKLMGPIGETLLMTALGLAVALPAVLAYNFINRNNALRMIRMQHFTNALKQG